MKKFINNKTALSKGVSTLDVIKSNFRIILLLSIITTLSGAIYGGHSILDSVDPSFDPQIQTNSFRTKTVSIVMPMPDGKILVAGSFNSYNRQSVGAVVRLNSDATIDTTFNSIPFASGTFVNKIIIQPDGRLILHGVNMRLTGQTGPSKNVIRLNSNGTLDTTFDYTLSGLVYDAAIDADGRIILSGFITDNDLITRNVIRLNSDGSRNTAFQFDTVVPTSVVKIATQGNKVIAATENGLQSIIRLNEDGSTDSAFTSKTLTNTQIRSITVQPDDKILVLSTTNLYRLNENGGDDGNFAAIAFSPFFPARQMALSNDGKIIVSTSFSTSEIKRYLANGNIDNSFTPYTIEPGVYSCHGVQSDGGIIIGDINNYGVSTNIPNHFSRLHPNGTLDTAFNAGGIGFQNINPGSIRTIAVQTDGKIMIGGKFDLVGDSARYKIARLNADSSLDTTFQISTSGTNYFTQVQDIYDVNIQPNGKILVSGLFNYSLNGLSKSNLVRLNADGIIDPTFSLDLIIDDLYGCCLAGKNKTAVLDNGKIVVGNSRNLISQLPFPLKLNTDGTRDISFNPTIYAAQNTLHIYDLAVQPDGKIIIGGRYGSTLLNAFLIRLNSDGSSDQTFNAVEQIGGIVSALALFPNGKILLAKLTSSSSQINRYEVLRLNSDGSLDNTLNAGTGASDRINSILVSSAGKIFIGGKFTEFNGQKRQNLAQLKPDGSLVSTDYSVNAEVLSLAMDGEGRLLVGGDFTVISVGGGTSATHTYIARLIDAEQLSQRKTQFDFDGDGRADIAVFRAGEGNWFINRSSQGFAASTFGTQTDRIVPADFDGDGKTDIAVYRSGNWYILNSASGFSAVQFGESTDIPSPADFDGDGRADIAVFRPSNGVWYVLGSRNGFYAGQFGASGDKPVAADYDGDGKADFAVFRNGNWYIQNSAAGFSSVQFGFGTDIPVAADYDGDGKTDIAVFRSGFWYMLESNGGFRGLQFGNPTDLPVPADYDGDGKTDIAVYRAGNWYMLKSSNTGFYAELFGFSTDKPIPAAFR